MSDATPPIKLSARDAELLARYAEDLLTDEQAVELNQRLHAEPGLLSAIAQHAELEEHMRALLDEEHAADQGDWFVLMSELRDAEQRAEALLVEQPAKTRPKKAPRRSGEDTPSVKEVAEVLWHLGKRPIVWGPLAAMLALAVTLVIVFTGRDGTPDPIAKQPDNTPSEPGRVGPEDRSPIPPSDPIVATLTAEYDAVWSADSAGGASAPGSPLRAGQRLTLTQGFAEVTTTRGAIALIEAPATIEFLDNPNAIYLHSGKLVGICETPSSKGFVVRTPHMDVVDLGTEFGVTVGPNRVETVVFDGEVEVYPTKPPGASGSTAPVRLSRGQYAAAGPAGTLASGQFSDGSVDLSYLRSLQPGDVASRRYAQVILESKPLIYWGMQDWAAGSVVNSGTAGHRHDGVAEAVEQQDGGVGGSYAYFDRAVDSMIKTDEPISELIGSDSYTIECWVRVEDYHRGMVFCMLAGDGIIHLEVIDALLGGNDRGGVARTVRWVHRDTSPEIDGQQLYSKMYPLGTWMHLVCVKNGDRLSLFVDGALVAEGTSGRAIADPSHLLLGLFITPGNREGDTRNFHGSLDEFAVYRRPLDAQTIELHYMLGSDALVDP
ncbi:MAG: LamG-like jellyroll fold domain-containing protein [Planctomycetota bacterium]